ncbi:hypothetical protein [Brevibacillus fulvus]|uniref:FixJ family two-component response regulator n=1 Tax=Brevibacillus fulvus TaxID=1125967 RepID=A0A938Y1K6_9BACL|nr:hypothetical protein [Brevibacillus fulvus]MBM7590729.1 FixJ family two-component response regulator [Brevibacillus fulvus]
MYYQSNQLIAEVQRILAQLQQNERNNANMLRSIANQLQSLAATETQVTATLQQLNSLTSQIAMEAQRSVGMSPAPAYEYGRSSVGDATGYSSAANSANQQNSQTSNPALANTFNHS